MRSAIRSISCKSLPFGSAREDPTLPFRGGVDIIEHTPPLSYRDRSTMPHGSRRLTNEVVSEAGSGCFKIWVSAFSANGWAMLFQPSVSLQEGDPVPIGKVRLWRFSRLP